MISVLLSIVAILSVLYVFYLYFFINIIGVSLNPFIGKKYDVNFDKKIKKIKLYKVIFDNQTVYYKLKIYFKDKKIATAGIKHTFTFRNKNIRLNKFILSNNNLKVNIIGVKNSNYREFLPYYVLNQVLNGANEVYYERLNSLKMVEEIKKKL